MINRDLVLIISHGSSEKESDNVLTIASRLHSLIHSHCKQNCVRVAYLQFQSPDVREAINDMVRDGARKVIIHPYFLSKGFHVIENIPQIIKDAQSEYPDVEFICTEHLGVQNKLAELIRDLIKDADQ